MRLLSTTDLSFREFYDSQIPKYAILSHRWIGAEVSFEEFHDVKAQDFLGDRFAKIKNCCAYAQKDGWDWVWMGTCCIDKKSSAELTEAINSMYAWYENAGVCYVYLADVHWNSDDLDGSHDSFRKSDWFKRGWTLQELLAPEILHFVDDSWNSIDTMVKGSESLSRSGPSRLYEDICMATGISDFDLRSHTSSTRGGLSCFARKMSWLSSRETSRVEDIAYCMLGVLGVNMPLLYGEGKKAFARLQMEYIKNYDDESIFAWFDPSTVGFAGVLANSPKAFARSGYVTSFRFLRGKMPFAMTNKGLHYRIPRPRDWISSPGLGNSYMLLLNCGMDYLNYPGVNPTSSTKTGNYIAIQLEHIAGVFYRVSSNEIYRQDDAIWNDLVDKGHEYEDLYLTPFIPQL